MEFTNDFEHILELCKSGKSVSPISMKESLDILQRLKPGVSDLYSITPEHYKHAGPAGLLHFNLLLNALLNDVNNTSISEVNQTYACVLFKGHGKDRSAASSYRTISTCPIVAKGLDSYIRDLFIKDWNDAQSPAQFQGHGSSHELAGLLLT